MKETENNKGNQPTDAKVFQPATVNETKATSPATTQTNNPAINKGSQQNSLQENNKQPKSLVTEETKKVTDTPDTDADKEPIIKGETAQEDTADAVTDADSTSPEQQKAK